MKYPSFLVTLTEKEENPNNVTIAFTMAMKSLDKGHDAAILLMSDAVHFAKKGYADGIDIGEPFPAAKDSLQGFLDKGGKLLVCNACMVHNNVTEEDDLIDEIIVITADDVIDYVTNAKSTLQLN